MDNITKLLTALKTSHLGTIEMNMHIDSAIEVSPVVNGQILVPLVAMRALQDQLSMNARLLSMTAETLETILEIIQKHTEDE